MLTDLLENIRKKTPLVHCMANYVTANDCANLLLAAGASPVMADDPMESAEITACCGALVHLASFSFRESRISEIRSV